MPDCCRQSPRLTRVITGVALLFIASLLGCAQPAESDGSAPGAAQVDVAQAGLTIEKQPLQAAATFPAAPTTTRAVTAESFPPTPTLRASRTPPPPPTPTSVPIIETSTAVPTAQSSNLYPLEVDPAEVERLLSSLSLEEKIGQMLMVGMPGSELDGLTRRRISEEGLGGVIFLEKNGVSPQQVRALTTGIQQAALNEGPGIPLFIAWNHEGGRVVRRDAGLTRFPSNMAVGAAGQPDLPFAIGQAVGQEMLSLGVNMNYAPVLDVNTAAANPVIGLRAYGDDPLLVAALGARYISGQQGAGVISVAKHFPGHGGVDVDSHVGLPLLSQSSEALWQAELPPFQSAIAANVGAIMVAHLEIPALDLEGWPSSLSPATVQGLLRDQLGYEGVIMTDDLGMGALNMYTPETKAIQAVQAGNDVLLTVNGQAYDIFRSALLQAIGNGQIPETRIDESVRRILHLKLAYGLSNMAEGEILPDLENHRQLMVDTGVAAVELTRDSLDWLPLNLPNNRLLLITPDKLNPGSATGDGISLLGEYLRGQGIDVTELIYGYDNTQHISQVSQQASSLIGSVDAVVVVTWDAILRYTHFGETAQETMVANMLALGKPVVVVAGSLPYDSQHLATSPALLKTYGDTPGQIAGLVSYLTGWK